MLDIATFDWNKIIKTTDEEALNYIIQFDVKDVVEKCMETISVLDICRNLKYVKCVEYLQKNMPIRLSRYYIAELSQALSLNNLTISLQNKQNKTINFLCDTEGELQEFENVIIQFIEDTLNKRREIEQVKQDLRNIEFNNK